MLSCDIKIRDINFSINLRTIRFCRSSKACYYLLQNDDNHDREAEQGGEHLGSACPRGPQGPVGPPGIEVGSTLFSNIVVMSALPICHPPNTPPTIWFKMDTLGFKVLTISTPTFYHPHLPSNLRVPAEQEMGISMALVIQQPINGLHLAGTQIAFFHCLPVWHTAFPETIRRAVSLERGTRLRKFHGLPTQACVLVLCCWYVVLIRCGSIKGQ